MARHTLAQPSLTRSDVKKNPSPFVRCALSLRLLFCSRGRARASATPAAGGGARPPACGAPCPRPSVPRPRSCAPGHDSSRVAARPLPALPPGHVPPPPPARRPAPASMAGRRSADDRRGGTQPLPLVRISPTILSSSFPQSLTPNLKYYAIWL